MAKNLEVYEPKKNISEKAKSIPKKYLVIVLAVFLIIGSVSSTYYVFKTNPDLAEKMLGVGSDSVEKLYTKTQSEENKEDSTQDSNSGSSSEKEPSETYEKDPEETKEEDINNSPEDKKTDYSTLKQDLLNNPFIKDLPEDGKIVLGFYNFDAGEREWEKHYILEKNSVKESNTQERDMKIFMHSKYVSEFRNKDICDIVGEAKENKDLGIETEMSKTELTWKYKNMMEYKDCLGM